MREPEVIQKNGKEVIYLNYSNLKSRDEIEYLTLTGSKLIRSKPLNSVLTMVNLDGLFFNNDIKNMIADNLKKNKPHVKKTAAFGLTGLLGAFFSGYVKITGRNIESCKNIDEALEYLTSNNIAT
ncbi:MAG: hypothetical protein JW798_11360 [Prolixibacteraceae bacterium]|nr:hypothetical protein [Prolixibacteraceae bacterium]